MENGRNESKRGDESNGVGMEVSLMMEMMK